MIAEFAEARPGPRNLLTDVQGMAVGQAHDDAARTGVTVILPDERAVAAVDVRGGAPGTRETDALDPDCLVEAVDAAVLAGGSVYGLDAASSVTAELGAGGRGYRLAGSNVVAPVVPAAILFDLTNGGAKDWGAHPPYAELGRLALASAGRDFALGNEGAGRGACTGAYKGGLGSASFVTAHGFEIGALAAVNGFGSPVIPGTDRLWAWPYEQDGEFGGLGPPRRVTAPGFPEDTKLGTPGGARPGGNTTIGVIAVNAALTPSQARRLAVMAQDGFARALHPVHTPFDGDTIFVLATGAQALPDPAPLAVTALGALAADCMARAVARGVYEAASDGGAPGYRSVFGV
ncbi:MAG: P1 family peptidase [Alphaproteobacteria bacterium]